MLNVATIQLHFVVPFATTVSLFLHKQFNEHDLYCITTYCYVSSTRFRLRGIITKMNCELNKYKLHRIVNVMKLTEKMFFFHYSGEHTIPHTITLLNLCTDHCAYY